MGFRLYRRIPLGRWANLNLSKTGVGISVGVPGLRYSVHSSGRRVRTVGLPGTGVFYRKDDYPFKGLSRTAETPPMLAKPDATPIGAARSPLERSFLQGVRSYMARDYEPAAGALEEAAGTDPAFISPEYFAAFAYLALQRFGDAIVMFRRVVASNVDLPDDLMRRCGIEGSSRVHVIPPLEIEVPYGHLSAALLLAEVLQQQGRPQEAVEILESLGYLTSDPIFALSLVDIYASLSRWDDIVRVTDDLAVKDVPASWALLYRANALQEKGLPAAARETLNNILNTGMASPDLVKAARYGRAVASDALGDRSKAMADFQSVYAVDPGFADVASRLGMAESK